MPSTRITDCVTELANAWLSVEAEYRLKYPGHALILTCTHRSQEEQFALYTKGRRQLGDGSWVVDEDPKTSVVTNCDGWKNLSRHNRKPAEALDFCVVLPGGKVSWDPREYQPVGLIAEARGLVWGGRFGTPPLGADYPHLEVRKA